MQVQSLAPLSGIGSSVALSCGVGHRRGSDSTPSPELPYAAGTPLKRPKKKKKNQKAQLGDCARQL